MTTRRAVTFALTIGSAIACAPSGRADGAELLLAARRAIGATDSITTISTTAHVTSPSGGFDAQIASATDGRVRLALGRSLVAGVLGGEGWSCDPERGRLPLDPVTRSVVRGHDLHMLVLSPSWLTEPTRDADRRWGTDSVLTVRFRDELGSPLLLHFRAADTLPVGLEVVNHTGTGPADVRVLFDDWQDHGGVRLFRTATFEHGNNRFVYRYAILQLNASPDSAFAPPCATAVRANVG